MSLLPGRGARASLTDEGMDESLILQFKALLLIRVHHEYPLTVDDTP